jgi:hypothetical protein
MTEVSDHAMKCPKCGVQLRKLVRSTFGKIVKYSFIIFNILMLVLMVTGVGSITDGYESMDTVEKAGTALGAGIGAMLLLIIWLIGDFILGLFTLLTRPKS